MRTPTPAALRALILVSLLFSALPAVGEEPVAPAVPESAPAAEPAIPESAPAVEPAAPEPLPAPAAAPEPAVEPPTITPDTQIFKRTPNVDGVVVDGEWDAYYTFSTPAWQAAVYADWDSDKLYIAAKSAKPFDLLALLDARADGWLNGDDNLELRAMRGEGDVPNLTVSRYDSKAATSSAAAAMTPEEAAAVEIKSSRSDNTYMVELAVPAAVARGLALSSGRKIGLQIALKTGPDESGWAPAAGPRSIVECELSTKKMVCLKPLDIGFDLRDSSIARGEELVGRFHVTNIGSETADVYSFVIAGEGLSGEYLSSQKVRMEGLPPKTHVAHDFRSIIPSDMPLGSWAIGAEVRSPDGRLGGALVSFDVVEPFEVKLRLPNKPVRADVKDVTFGVIIANNTSRGIRGSAKITLPVGWELWRNADVRDFSARRESISSAAFKAKPPLGVDGDVPVKVEVTVDEITKTAEGSFRIVNP